MKNHSVFPEMCLQNLIWFAHVHAVTHQRFRPIHICMRTLISTPEEHQAIDKVLHSKNISCHSD